MGLLGELGIDDPTQVDADAIEQQVANGGLPAEGFHHAVLDGCRSVTANTGSQAYELSFKILTGSGGEVKATIWLPNAGQDAAKREKTRAKVCLYGHRLGVLRKVPIAGTSKHSYVEATPGRSFPDALGTQVVIEVQHEEREYEKDGKKRKIKEAVLTYSGVYTLDDPQVAKVPRANSAAIAAATSTGPAGGAAPKDVFDDL